MSSRLARMAYRAKGGRLGKKVGLLKEEKIAGGERFTLVGGGDGTGPEVAHERLLDEDECESNQRACKEEEERKPDKGEGDGCDEA